MSLYYQYCCNHEFNSETNLRNADYIGVNIYKSTQEPGTSA